MTTSYETRPGADVERATLGTPFEKGLTRYLACNGSGNLKITLATDEVVDDFPVVEGMNPIKVKMVEAPTTGAAPTAVFGVY